ncbi:MAG: 30S ribosomal protein S6e [Euryarchaeota archaeon]|nr:30S ribosomal protein S6e [Euryarchaeota archaeon]
MMVLSEPDTGRAYKVSLTEDEMKAIVGRKIGDVIDGSAIGLPGLKIQLTGGSDRDGFPMRRDVHGAVRRRILLRSPPGFRPRERGEVRRKRVRGNVYVPEIVQVNAKIVEKGEKSVEEMVKEREG